MAGHRAVFDLRRLLEGRARRWRILGRHVSSSKLWDVVAEIAVEAGAADRDRAGRRFGTHEALGADVILERPERDAAGVRRHQAETPDHVSQPPTAGGTALEIGAH